MKKVIKASYQGLPKLCSVCGRTFHGRDATEGQTGPIICLMCWNKMQAEQNMKVKGEPS